MTELATSTKARAMRILNPVELKLSRQQFESLVGILQYFMGNCSIDLLEDRATAFRVVKFYESKMRSKIFGTTPKLKMKLNISECEALRAALETSPQGGFYEENLTRYLLSEIDKQTV